MNELANTPPAPVAGRYLLREVLGSGGLATVYRAQDSATGQTIALKQLHRVGRRERQQLVGALFAREFHTLARLSHRSIVRVYDYGISQTGPYYTMELLEGSDLRQRAPLAYREACRYLRDVASSLALLHAHRLVHRDVSPRNVRTTEDGGAKLIDFGALAGFGVSSELIGTAPCTAPEVLRRMPLDQRTDLYSLGAVAYYVLTGHHAYPVRTHAELPDAWRVAPTPPSSFDPTIPLALDALVTSLLRLDPSERPPHAASVIDQLTTIASLDDEELEHSAESYLQSGPMVGRAEQIAWIRERLRDAGRGRGATVVVEGAAGVGRTRFLSEACLEGQLSGALLLTANGLGDTSPFRVAKALVADALRLSPEIAEVAARPHLPLLRHVIPGLRKLHSNAPPASLSHDPSERRARFQMALLDILLRIAQERALVIAVDDVQGIDDNSAALLAALSLETRARSVLLIATQRMHEPVSSPGSIRALRRHSEQLRLRPLDRSSCAELVDSLFGGAENSGRLALLLYERSAGNPQRCMDLARLLVKRGIARYVGGTWVLPQDVSDEELPSQLVELVAARCALLSPGALNLAQGLSVYDGPIPLSRALAVAAAEGQDEAASHRALDELLEEQVLRVEADCYRIDQSGLREQLLEQMDPSTRRARHLRAAAAIDAEQGQEQVAIFEAGYHLIRGGQEIDGARRLMAMVDEILHTQQEPESYDQVAEALLTAIRVCDREGRGDHEIARALFALMSIGFLADWRYAEDHGERAVRVGLEITGLRRAAQLRDRLGAPLALAIGLGSGALALARHGPRGTSYGLLTAIRDFCAIVPPTLASWTMRYDNEGAARLISMLAALRMFGPRHVTTLMHDYGVMQLLMIEGRDREASRLLAELLARFEQPKVKRQIGDLHWRLLKGGLLFAQGILATLEYRAQELAIADELEQLDVRLWAMGASQLRLLHHAHRGEADQAAHYLDRVELMAIQGGATWQAELYWPFLLMPCHVESGDVVGARRCVEQLERRGETIKSLQPIAEVCRAAYLTMRGQASEALEIFERRKEDLVPGKRAAWPVMRLWHAQALTAEGRLETARAVLEETETALGPEDDCLLRHKIMLRRELAQCVARGGQPAQAARTLDELLERYGGQDQPLVVGLLHKSRAEVARELGDDEAFRRHATEMGRAFRATDNPVLLASWERLCGHTRSGEAPGPTLANDDVPTSVTKRRRG